MARLKEHNLKDADAPKKGRLLRLEEVVRNELSIESLHLDHEIVYDGQGVTGKDDLTPSPERPVNEKESREFLKHIAEKSASGFACKLASEIAKDAPEIFNAFSKCTKPIPLWANRDKKARKEDGSRVSVVDWIQMHHGILHDDSSWESNGLKRADLRYDMPLYTAFAQWLKNHPEDDFDPDSRRELKRYDDPEEAINRIRAQKRDSNTRLKK